MMIFKSEPDPFTYICENSKVDEICFPVSHENTLPTLNSWLFPLWLAVQLICLHGESTSILPLYPDLKRIQNDKIYAVGYYAVHIYHYNHFVHV